MWIGCYDWSARKILWVAWTWNALVQTIWGLLAVVQGQKINKLHDTFEPTDRTSANLVTGIVATSAWAVVLIGLFLIFSLVVLLKKVRVSCVTRSEPPRRRVRRRVARTNAGDAEKRRPTNPREHASAARERVKSPADFAVFARRGADHVFETLFSTAPFSAQTIAKTGAGFSYGLIVGSAIHMFFVLGEAGVSLYSHERWLNDLGNAVWSSKDAEMFAAVAGFGLFAACCYLVLAILMIVYMSAVMEDKKEPLSSFRDRYGLGPSGGGSSSQAA